MEGGREGGIDTCTHTHCHQVWLLPARGVGRGPPESSLVPLVIEVAKVETFPHIPSLKASSQMLSQKAPHKRFFPTPFRPCQSMLPVPVRLFGNICTAQRPRRRFLQLKSCLR